MKFVALISALMLLAACEGHQAAQITSSTETKTTSVYGGEVVDAEDSVARKVFYLRIGYDRTQKPQDDGSTVSSWKTLSCTASALTPRVLITAAHCFRDTTENISVDVTMPDGSKQTVQGLKYMTHRLWPEDRTADIAMVLLETALPEETELVSLPPAQQNLDLKSVLVAGYGYPNTFEKVTGTLRKGQVEVQEYDPLNEMLILNQRNGIGACTGDSGGSALIEKDGVTYTVGIMSYARFHVPNGSTSDQVEKCGFEGVFVNVQFHLDWIHSVLKNWEQE